MADLAQNIAALSPERRKLLERLLKKEGVDIAKALIVPQPRDDRPLPLSFAQQRLWFLDQFEPGSPFYNIPTAVRLSGRLDIAALERSLNAILRRHETLRTTFATVQNQPVQVIAPALTLTVPLIDLRGLPAEQGEAEMQRLAAEEASCPFDLAQGPLLRATLIRLGDEEHVALLTMHHIISDGWSMGIFIGEVFTLYEAELAGRPAALPDLKIQYADFAAWQRQWLQGESSNGRADDSAGNHSASPLQVQLDYWKRQLGAGPPVLELPTDRPRPPVRSSRGAAQSHKLPSDLTEALTALGNQEGATLFMTLLAAFQILLQRYSGQDEFTIGTPIANRTRAEIEPLIGFFVNTLVLQADLTGEPSFRDVLRRARETALGAFAHQDLPFEMLVEAIQPERDMSRTPLFQVIFVLQNTPMRSRQLPGLSMRQVETTSGTARFDLALSVVDQRDGLHITLGYSTDLFEAATIERMLGHLQTLLEGIAANPDRPIAQLPLLTEAEQRQILVEWNATAAPYPDDRCIHDLFVEQVARTPDAVAVTFADAHLTFAELNARANQLAHHLRALGVGPETLVGLCVERSVEMLVGLLGILKTGGAYVPLDPSYPAERLAFMLADAQPAALLATDAMARRLSASAPQRLIKLDTDWPTIAQQPTTNPDGGATAANLAYVMYTSGSTGQPKGVTIEHRSLVNYLYWANEQLLGDKVRHLPVLTRLTFDASLKQLFAPLLRGDTVWMLPDDIALQPAALLQSVSARTQVGLNCVPSLWEAILSSIEAGEAPSPGERLTTLFVGGEQLRPELVERSLKLFPGLRIWNLYGPTEATANASANGSIAADNLTIGRPIANTQIYVLDPQLRPVPPGVPGELHIGGAGLARGYYKRPELTAEKFVPNPFGAGRLYKTGDLVRYWSDGAIEFLGRIDQQVKLRGYRIELGEIEAALRQHPAVRDAVALVREDHPGDKRLAAYLVIYDESCETNAADPDADLGRRRVALIADLRVFLKGKLPDYMLPTNLVFLDALPQLPNGKIDRKALPAPDQAWSELREAYTAPRTPTEQILSAIWADVLQTAQVGLHDNFFELGGHSLMATQVIARVREAFQIELPLRRLFETPTVASLAEQIDLACRDTSARQAPPITPVAQPGDLPLSFAQQRLWFLNQLEPESPSYNIPNAVHLSGELHVDVLERCINEIVRRHAILRTVFRTVDGRAVQVIAPEMQVALALVDLRQIPVEQREAEARRLADEEFRRPFDLAHGPLLRTTLLRLDDQDHIALFTMHHIISDGWSGGILVREVSILYAAFVQQQASSLPDLLLQYVDFAAWQRQWLQGADERGQSPLQQQLDYWKRQMGDDQPALQLPTDRPRPAIQTGNGAHMPFTITQHLTEGLYALSRSEGATLFMTLLTAFQVLLHRYSGQDDIRVGTPIANRTQTALEGLIGCFINTLVLRANVAPGQSFRQTLAQSRETALEAYANQDAPFEMVVEAVQPERDLSRTPLFQVMFILQNTPAKVLELPGLQLAPFNFDLKVSPFDLTMILEETPAGLHGAIEYSTDLFDASTVTRFLEHFEMLLIGIVADPDRALAAIPLLSDAERRRIMVEWNNTARSWDTNTRISDLFEAQAARTPDAVAVKYEGSQISYAELNRQANQLAHYLRKHGVGPEVLVA
ncbi:MAG: amino acid adenylation domain-containing protein, partial [Chloroflexales bacterium]|nr:amino acid adenylation domain-containing protein [Chloroflexales bacterium]